MKSYEDISFKSLLLQCTRKRPEEYSTAVIEEIGEVLEQRNHCSRTDCIVSVVFKYFQGQRLILSISSTSHVAKLHI